MVNSRMNPQDEALSVTQADRDAAFALDNAMSGGFLKPEERLAYLSGERDDWHNVQAFARHRLSHSTPGDAEVRKAAEFLLWMNDRRPRDVPFAKEAWEALRLGLATPSGRAQEPVAYLVEHKANGDRDTAFQPLTDADKAAGWTETPLYAAPPAQDQGENEA